VPFAAHTESFDKRRAGRTGIAETQLELRSGDNQINQDLHDWVYERLGRQLGKYAPQIERLQVRFGDENGPKGAGKTCLVHVILSKLPPVVVECRGNTEREAFDLAAGRAERALRRNVQKHGYSMKDGKHKREQQESAMSALPDRDESTMEAVEESTEEPIMGRREGHGADPLMLAAERPEKVRRDLPVDTSQPDTSADDRKVGSGHTAKRNTKLNTSGMAYALEDSTTGRPSRKSTRGSANGIKHANPLTRLTKSSVMSPKSQAGRITSRGH
jgi:hypothetical protein